FTLAASTPSTRESARSTRRTHEAHVIPRISRVTPCSALAILGFLLPSFLADSCLVAFFLYRRDDHADICVLDVHGRTLRFQVDGRLLDALHAFNRPGHGVDAVVASHA